MKFLQEPKGLKEFLDRKITITQECKDKVKDHVLEILKDHTKDVRKIFIKETSLSLDFKLIVKEGVKEVISDLEIELLEHPTIPKMIDCFITVYEYDDGFIYGVGEELTEGELLESISQLKDHIEVVI